MTTACSRHIRASIPALANPQCDPTVRADQLSSPPRVIQENDRDVELVERCIRGDREAFTELVIRSFWVLRRAEDANDVTRISRTPRAFC